MLASTIWSCSSRKTNRSKTEQKSESKIEASLESSAKAEIETQNDIKKESSSFTENDISETAVEAEPIDAALPMEKTEVVEGNKKTTTWKNAKVKESSKIDKSKKEEKEYQVDLSTKNENQEFILKSKLKAKEESLSKADSKETDAKRGFNLWWLLLMIIPAGLYVYWKSRD